MPRLCPPPPWSRLGRVGDQGQEQRGVRGGVLEQQQERPGEPQGQRGVGADGRAHGHAGRRGGGGPGRGDVHSVVLDDFGDLAVRRAEAA